MSRGLARAVTTHPWWVIATWIVASAMILAFSPKLVDYTTSNSGAFLPSHYESVQASDVAAQDFPSQSGANGSIVVSRADGAVLSSADQQKVVALATSLTNDHIPSVTKVSTSPELLSRNGKVYLINVLFNGQPGAPGVNAAVPVIRDNSTSLLKGSGLEAGLTGSAAIQVDTVSAYNTAETIIAVATISLIVILLAITFRSPLIAVLPIVVIGLVHQVAASLTAVMAKAFGFQVGPILPPLLVVVLFGIGTDYIIFLLFRYREQLRERQEPVMALRAAVKSVGEVIASAALTVAAAFAALVLASLGSLRTLAPGLIVAVVCMLLAAVTLVPALFSVLGTALFWPHGIGDPRTEGASARLGAKIASHPGRVVAIYGLVLIGLGVAALGYTPTYNTLQELPKSTPSLEAYNVMQTAFPPGALGPTQVLVSGSQPLTSDSLSNLDNRLSHAKGVSTVFPPQFSSKKTGALVTVLLSDDPYSTQALDNVEGPVRTAAHGSVPGDRVLVGGATSQLVDVRAALQRDMAVIFPVALGIIAVILALLLRAVVAPLYLLLGVSMSFVATLGVTVLVFLSAGGLSGLDFSIPIVLYLFVVAIGTDYNILMAHRLREEFDQDRPPHEAARIAVLHGAPAVHAAALILAGSFASLMLTGIASLTELGFGVAIGIVIAALAMATRLLPAVAALRGWRFWWPSRVHQRTAETVTELHPRATASSGARS